MSNDFDDFEDFLNLHRQNVRVPKRYIRDIDNIFERYDDKNFKIRYRFEKVTVIHHIVPLIEKSQSLTNRGLPFPAYLKALIALRFYATASFQMVTADLFNISTSSACRVINSVSHLLACQVQNFVKFPTNHEDFNTLKYKFYQKYAFPGVIGLIDGTHIPIKSPGGDQAEIFRNRKTFFSINVQVVGGPDEELLDVVVRWPGSTHDCRIFENSKVRVRLSEGELPGHLLADSGYAQRTYIFTPIGRPSGILEERYNSSHKSTRSLIERIIGRWKRRFPCLYYELQCSLKSSQRIITACAVLYNIGIGAGDMWLDDDSNGDIIEIPNNVVVNNAAANEFRKNFIVRHFSH